MAFRELSETRRQQLRYGALGIVALVLAGGVILFLDHGTPGDQAAVPAVRGAATPASSTAEVKPLPLSADEQPPPTDIQMDKLRKLVAEARQHAADGEFDAAQASLQAADQVAAKRPETEQARREIAAMATPEGQLKTQLQRARFAVEHDDVAVAEKALAAAEKLKPDAPEIAELRASLKAEQAKLERRSGRVAQLLTRMRDALARNDLAAADSALNEAERIDLQDPTVRRARADLNRAHNRDQQAEQQGGAPAAGKPSSP